MGLDPLRPLPLVEQAVQSLREQIVKGHWPVGTKLPGEASLAKSLGVGRSTVREALRSLAGSGLVRPRQGAGVFVIATELRESWSTRLRRAALTDIYEVRMLVEVEAARLAAERRTEEDLAAIDACLAERVASAARGTAEFVDADIALHAAIVGAVHNPVLTGLFSEFVPSLRQGLIDLVELLRLRTDDPAHGEEGHVFLVEAIARGDAEAAGRILHQELETTLTRLRAL